MTCFDGYFQSCKRFLITEIVFRRILKTENKPFTFNTSLGGNYNALDVDVKDVMPLLPYVVYLAMYAVSYGIQDVSTPIYSYPVYLGYLRLSQFQ